MTQAADAAAHHAAAHRRRLAIGAAKVILAVAILGYLFYSVRGEELLGRLVKQPKDWTRLALAQLAVITGISLNYVRWFVLVRALGLDFRLTDAFRLGLLGHLINQVAPGSVGGDLFKAVFVAREHPGKRTEAVASVVIDRIVGLYAMLLVATCGRIYAVDFPEMSPVIETLANIVAAFAIAGTVGIVLLMTPALTGPRVCRWLRKLPVAGHTLARLVEAAAAYRHERRYLFAGILIACCTHTLLVVAIWLAGTGLPVDAPTLPETFLVGPLSLCAGAIPLTPAGLGTFETAMDRLYMAVGAPPGDGLLVALAYRLMTYVLAALGAVYYLRARKTVGQVLHEAEDLADEMETT